MFIDTLTNLLHRSRGARSTFRRNMNAPSRQPRPSLKVTPISSFMVSPGDVGRAYDLWIRVVSITLNHLGKQEFRNFLGYQIYNEKNYAALPSYSDLLGCCMSALDKCYDSECFLGRNLLKSLLIIGYFEREYRTGLPVIDPIGEANRDSINELGNLAEASDISWLQGEIALNPDFSLRGEKGSLLGDGDLIVNHTLYELKTTREFRRLETLRQLLGYTAMNSLVSPNYTIDAVGFYYVRYNKRVEIMLSDLVTPKQLKKLQLFIRNKLGMSLFRLDNTAKIA